MQDVGRGVSACHAAVQLTAMLCLISSSEHATEEVDHLLQFFVNVHLVYNDFFSKVLHVQSITITAVDLLHRSCGISAVSLPIYLGITAFSSPLPQ